MISSTLPYYQYVNLVQNSTLFTSISIKTSPKSICQQTKTATVSVIGSKRKRSRNSNDVQMCEWTEVIKITHDVSNI